MPDFTSVFTQERDHWQARAEAAEAELERRTKIAAESLAQWTASRNDWRDRAHRMADRACKAEAEVERLRGALDGLAVRWRNELVDDNTNGYGAALERCLDDIEAVLRGDQ